MAVGATVEPVGAAPRLKRSLGLWLATALVVGKMIGSGVFQDRALFSARRAVARPRRHVDRRRRRCRQPATDVISRNWEELPCTRSG